MVRSEVFSSARPRKQAQLNQLLFFFKASSHQPTTLQSLFYVLDRQIPYKQLWVLALCSFTHIFSLGFLCHPPPTKHLIFMLYLSESMSPLLSLMPALYLWGICYLASCLRLSTKACGRSGGLQKRILPPNICRERVLCGQGSGPPCLLVKSALCRLDDNNKKQADIDYLTYDIVISDITIWCVIRHIRIWTDNIKWGAYEIFSRRLISMDYWFHTHPESNWAAMGIDSRMQPHLLCMSRMMRIHLL